jgi:RND family efflux transporter MFP subunit
MSENTSQSNAAQHWLHSYCESDPRVKSALVLLATGGTQQEAAHWPVGDAARVSLLAAARVASRRARPLVLTPPVGGGTDGEPGRVVALPLVHAQSALGVLAFAVQPGLEESDQALLGELEKTATALVVALQEASSVVTPSAGNRLLQLQVPLLGKQSLEQAASALCSELASNLGFDRVSLGLGQRAGLKLIALSHGAEFGRRQGLSQALAAAMQESIDQAVSISYPLAAEVPPRIVQAHATLAAQGPGSVLSVPLIGTGEAIGSLCFERERPVTADELAAIEELASRLAPLMALKQRAEHPWSARAADCLHAWWGGRSQRSRRLAWFAALVAVVLLALMPYDYRIGASARLEGEVQRVVAAPTDGYLHAAHVRPGDTVKAGQLLVELAQQDLQLENHKWEAELNQHQNSAAGALARGDRTQYALAQARATEGAAQLELAREQLARTQLTAPIDGLVIKGDLSQSLGAPVQRGEVLLTLAPHEAFRLIIDVDERDIGTVVLGQHGQLALSALPGERLEFIVSRITPVAQAREGRNVFEVEASFDKPPAGLRPGLQGVAKIDAGSRRLGWIATHRLSEWLGLTFWGWTGLGR